MRLHLVHYGSEEFALSKFSPIANYAHKPKGGLWASPVDSKHSWKDWCIGEQFGLSRLDISFEFIFDGNAFVIDGIKDCEKLMMAEVMPNYRVIDFERMSQSYDAIYMTARGEGDTRYSDYHLYGWDCESVLVMNPNVIIPCPVRDKSAKAFGDTNR